MLHFLICLATAAVLLGQAGGTAAAPNDDAARRAAYLAAFNAQDAAAVTKLYASDAVFLPFTGQLITGGAVIGPAITRLSARVTLELEPSSASASGGLWFEAGTWRHVERGRGARSTVARISGCGARTRTVVEDRRAVRHAQGAVTLCAPTAFGPAPAALTKDRR